MIGLCADHAGNADLHENEFLIYVYIIIFIGTNIYI